MCGDVIHTTAIMDDGTIQHVDDDSTISPTLDAATTSSCGPTQRGPQFEAESEASAARIAHWKNIEESVDAPRAVGQKPHKMRVKAYGGIDGGCDGNNEFDKVLRSLIPRILDVSCVK